MRGGPPRRLPRPPVRQKPAWPGSAQYWEERYRSGGTCGLGSVGEFAAIKADVVNDFVRKEGIQTVIEFGCGDGLQLMLAEYPGYIGLDVSTAALLQCSTRFFDDPIKSFFHYSPVVFVDRRRLFHGELALSLEVIFHLVEDDVFDRYMSHLFGAADRFVFICSTNVDLDIGVPHRSHRQFSTWIDDHAPG